MTSKAWYLVALGFVIAGLAIGGVGFTQGQSAIEDMHRVAMPGKHEIILPAGTSTLYAEHHSVVEGTVIQAPESLTFRCGLVSPAGTAIALETSTSSVKYGMGGYAGRNVSDVQIAVPGTYILSCTSESPFAMAIGGGIGTWIVVALVGGMVPGMLAMATFVIVFVKRRRQKRRLAGAPVR